MTRKKGIALIISLTLLVSIALPGTLAFSGDSTATNENLTLEEENPAPTPENSAEEKVCTCSPQPGEGETHKEECPLYTAPEAPAEEENGCTCDPKPSEGELHGESYPFYTPVIGTTAAAEGTDSTGAESAAGYIRIKINVFCVDDDGIASPQPGVPVEVRRYLYGDDYYVGNKELPGWRDGLSMFSEISDTSGVVYIDAPYTIVKDPNDAANDTAYLGKGETNDNDHVVYQRRADTEAFCIRFAIEPVNGSGYALNAADQKIRNWISGQNGRSIDLSDGDGYRYDDFVFQSGLVDIDSQTGTASGASIEFDLYVKNTASTEEPPEETVDIHYEPVGPAGAVNFGSVTTMYETVKVMTVEAQGSTAVPGNGFVFVGWYTNPECTIQADESWVSGNTIRPGMIDGKNVSATYYAKFDYAVADLTIKQDGEIADENQTFIYVVTGGDLPEGGIKVAVKGRSSVTIRNLKIGSYFYTVTEETGWNWRCGTGSSAQNITLQGAQKNEVSFTNNGSNFKWLDGNAYSKIVFENK